MSYCRFYNTKNDLRDCAEHFSEPLSGEEYEMRKRLAEICYDILSENNLLTDDGKLDEEELSALPKDSEMEDEK